MNTKKILFFVGMLVVVILIYRIVILKNSNEISTEKKSVDLSPSSEMHTNAVGKTYESRYEVAYYIEDIVHDRNRYVMHVRTIEFDWECTDVTCPDGYSVREIKRKSEFEVSKNATITLVSDPYYRSAGLGIIEMDSDKPDWVPQATVNFYELAKRVEDKGISWETTFIQDLPFNITFSHGRIIELDQIYLP